jgi:hypothetical protein
VAPVVVKRVTDVVAEKLTAANSRNEARRGKDPETYRSGVYSSWVLGHSSMLIRSAIVPFSLLKEELSISEDEIPIEDERRTLHEVLDLTRNK